MTGVWHGTGIQVDVDRGKYNADPPPFEGRHLWVFVAAWTTTDPVRERQTLDTENLLSISGPGCYWCEQVWTPTIGAHCAGDPA